MYKIELYDYNCSPICDGTTSFFTDDIEEFERQWFELEYDEKRKERFARSKAGEMVTDYYNDSPELNIVQFDNARIYGERDVTLEDITFEATNAYWFTERYHVNQLEIHFQWIAFKNQYYRIASYSAIGVCMVGMFCDDRLKSVECSGNRVLINKVVYDPKYLGWIPESEWPNPTYDDFRENTIQTICYITNAYFSDEKELQEDMKDFTVTDEVLDRLFADVIGEAG